MASKVIYFVVDGRKEKAEFKCDDCVEDVRDVFRSAAEAAPDDILKLYNSKGNLVNVSPKLEENTPDKPYQLHVIATQFNGTATVTELGFDVAELDERLHNLERKVLEEHAMLPDTVHDMKRQVDDFKEKLEHVDHLSWLGLHKDISIGTSLGPIYKREGLHPKTIKEHHAKVFDKFLQISQVQMTDDVRSYLKKPSFDNWQWDDSEMLILLRQMFIDLGLTQKFSIDITILQNWLFEIYTHYNQVPFHNFKHCFMVTQMMYGLIWIADLQRLINDDLDILILMTSAICHDLDHPGYNNAYQVNARTELALRYNDISPLENHHAAVAFELFEREKSNILKHLNAEQYKKAREGIIKCILATDMSRHSEILAKFKLITPDFDYTCRDHMDVLMKILIKVSDISNEVRPQAVSEQWIDCLLTEFFNQSDLEKLEGLPVAPFMDREKVNKPVSQIGFIKFVLLPLFESLAQLLPNIVDNLVTPVKESLEYYQTMKEAMELEDKKLQRKMSVSH